MKNISQTNFFLTTCIVISVVNIQLILNSEGDISKNKVFFNYQKKKGISYHLKLEHFIW